MTPTGSTRVAAVIGSPVRHSLSPAIHNAAFASIGLDWTYVVFEVAPGRGSDAVRAMRVLGIGGLSVTMPHKADVLAAVDDVTADVRALGAANTIVCEGGRLIAHSTDGAGCIDALREAGVEPSGKRCLVIGAGGAGRAVIRALTIAGAASIGIVNRDDARAESALALAAGRGRRATLDEVSDAEIIVNATPVGMGDDRTIVVDPARLAPGQVVNDLVYHPLLTPLIGAAQDRGATTVGGLGMLLHQAARQFALWTGVPAPIDAMRAAIDAALAGP